MSLPTDNPLRKKSKTPISRKDLIRVVTTPLGFFVLVVLVVEAFLTMIAVYTDDGDRTLAIQGCLALIFVLVVVVGLLAFFRPNSLTGKEPENLRTISKQLQRIEDELLHRDQTARYGSSGLLIAALLGLQDSPDSLSHCHAGGLTISSILLGNIPNTANEFSDLFHGKRTDATLTEHHVVDNFLRNLLRTLPVGSVWLGVTQLQSPDAWQELTANVAYYDFQTNVVRRVGNQELTYFRLWNFADDKHLRDPEIESIMRKQQEAGLQIRFTHKAALDDLSLIWVPKHKTKKALTLGDSPVDDIEAKANLLRPLCAIKFRNPRGGRELEEIKVYAPKSREFTELRRDFREGWESGKSIPVGPK